MDGWDAKQALTLIEAHRVTHTHMVPTMFHRMLSLPAEVREQFDLSSLQFVLHGAAPCPVAVKQSMIEWLGPIVNEYYAATEGSGAAVDAVTWLKKPGTVGKPLTSGHIKIIDEQGNECPPNQAGAVYLAAPEVGKFNYYKDEAKTADTFRMVNGKRYVIPGDYATIEADGRITLLGRGAVCINSGGEKIFPEEVESVLKGHPSVMDVLVVGLADERWGQRVAAVVEARPATVVDVPDVDAFARKHLAGYKCPKQWFLCDKIERQPSGKPDYKWAQEFALKATPL